MLLKILFFLILFFSVILTIGIAKGYILTCRNARKKDGDTLSRDSKISIWLGAVLCLAFVALIWWGAWSYCRKYVLPAKDGVTVELSVEGEESAAGPAGAALPEGAE